MLGMTKLCCHAICVCIVRCAMAGAVGGEARWRRQPSGGAGGWVGQGRRSHSDAPVEAWLSWLWEVEADLTVRSSRRRGRRAGWGLHGRCHGWPVAGGRRPVVAGRRTPKVEENCAHPAEHQPLKPAYSSSKSLRSERL